MAGITGWFSDRFADAKKGWSKYNNRKFKEAAMAACARAAAASGGVSQQEMEATAAVIAGIPELAPFDPADLFNIFQGYATKLDGPMAMIGKITADRAIAEIKKDPGAAAACVQIMLAVCNADGTFDDAEKKVAREICGTLGIDPAPYVS